MMLNLTQKTIIFVALFCVAAMVLYPPWVLTIHPISSPTIVAAHYSFIWSPPRYARFIDLYRLSAQLVGLFVIAIGLCLVCNTKKHKETKRKQNKLTIDEIEERKKALEEAGNGIDYRSIEEGRNE